MEVLGSDLSNGHDQGLLDVFGKDVLTIDQNGKDSGAKKMQAQILAEMLAIDAERAVTTMRAWATFIQLASSRPRSIPFSNLEEYLPYRINDAGEMSASLTLPPLDTAYKDLGCGLAA